MAAAWLTLTVPPAQPPEAPEGAAPAARARFYVDRAGYKHLTVHTKGRKSCPDARLTIEYRGPGSPGVERLEAVQLLADGETVAATLWVPEGYTIFSVAPAEGTCAELEIESVELAFPA